MHFRMCVAFVVREYAGRHFDLPDPTQVTQQQFDAFIRSLDKSYAELVAAVYLALCGVEPDTAKARLTVTDWLRKPETLCKVRI
jgi:hypothetical protein